MAVEVERERAAFEGDVEVRVERGGDGGTRAEKLTLRVLPGARKNAQGQRVGVLHIELTKEDDLFFLYTLQVSEEDFHELKSEQSLLVDFAGFPPKFIDLLGRCRDAAGQFLCVLDLEGLPVLRIVEANHFKQLTHLALRFQPATSGDLQAYLAGRLRQAQTEARTRQAQAERTQADLDAERAAGAEARARADKLQHEMEGLESRLGKEHGEALAKQREESLKLLAQTQNAASEQARKQQEQADRRAAELEAQLSSLQAEHRKVYELKAAAESRAEQLAAQVAAMDKFAKDGASELGGLRGANRELEASRFELEKKLNEQQLSLVAVRQQLQDKEEVLDKTNRMLEEANERRAVLEEKAAQYKATTGKLQRKLELSISEINKGNHVIEGLQTELRQAREKIKTKNLVLRQQEKVLQEVQNALEDQRQLAARNAELLRTEKDTSRELRTALDASKAKLEECNKMLRSNQNVITFLNKEINEAQLRPGVAGRGIRLDTALQTPQSFDAGDLAHSSKFDLGSPPLQQRSPYLSTLGSPADDPFPGMDDLVDTLGAAPADSATTSVA